MSPISSQILEAARGAQSNVFIESGTHLGYSFQRALESGIFERCYTVEIVPKYYEEVVSRYPVLLTRQVFLGKSHEVFRKRIFPLCSSRDRIFFWLDGHFSGGPTGGADSPCPLLIELEVIRRHCPSSSLVVAIDDVDDFGAENLTIPGRNWPTRAEVDAAVYRVNSNFVCLDYTGKGSLQKMFRGVLIFLHRALDE